MREDQTEVLVVGAGPVGLWTALLLKEAGIETAIIDREERTAARSYACALHAHTLRLMEPTGLAAEAIELGRRVEKLAFYDGETRQAEVKFSGSDRDYPFVLILPQMLLRICWNNVSPRQESK